MQIEHFTTYDTIAAIASPPGGGARGIVRVAGPHVAAALAACFHAADGRPLADLRLPTCIAGRIELDELGGRQLPCDLYFWPTERSYCRSPMAEIHTLGSPPLLAAVLRTVCAAGARAAVPGEFTLRAFLGGRLDLAQAEAVLGVIDADGQREFDLALSQLSGGLSRPLARLRDELLEMLAHLEAGLDFVEEDIDFISAAELDAGLAAALEQIEALMARMESRTEASQTIKVVLRGRANAGKSSLFNALASRYQSPGASAAAAALVSPQPGTTRDYLTARLTLGGVECELIDTAGLAESETLAGPDRSAQSMTQEQIGAADVEVHCIDATQPPVETGDAKPRGRRLIALTKCDLPQQIAPGESTEPNATIKTSAATGEGLAELVDAIRRAACDSENQDGAVVAATAQRCRSSLAAATASLHEARRLTATGGAEELLAAEIRASLNDLGQVTGAVYTDDILDRVFSRFCIGK